MMYSKQGTGSCSFRTHICVGTATERTGGGVSCVTSVGGVSSAWTAVHRGTTPPTHPDICILLCFWCMLCARMHFWVSFLIWQNG